MLRRGNKYGAKRTNGFSSGLENAVYCLLKQRERDGEISEIECQSTVVFIEGSRKEKIAWRVDFSFLNLSTGKRDYCEAKGMETDLYKIKLKLWRYFKPGRLEIWKGSASRPYLDEVIE